MPRGVYDRFTHSLKDRLLNRVMPVTECGCLFFLGSLNHAGYGWINDGFGDTVLAHRASYQVFKGIIPRGLIVLHSCDVPCCVNPDHLSLGSDADNAADKVRKNRQKRTLSIEDVLAIRADPTSSLISLARRHGITYQQVANIRSRKQWTHI